MIILDFLFFYLTQWFKEHQDKLKWSTPLERTAYVMGLVTGFWIIIIWEVVEIFIIKSLTLNHIPLIPTVVVMLILIQIYQYAYVKRKRYELVIVPKFGINKTQNTGKFFSIIIVIISFILPYILFMVFT